LPGRCPILCISGLPPPGPLESGLIKGAIGVGTLLAEGLGDTVRISLTADPLAEVRVARHILEILHLRPRREPELISCPTCGRCEVNLIPLVNRVAKLLHDYPHPVKVAVMGCAVNGPVRPGRPISGSPLDGNRACFFAGVRLSARCLKINLWKHFKKS